MPKPSRALEVGHGRSKVLLHEVDHTDLVIQLNFKTDLSFGNDARFLKNFEGVGCSEVGAPEALWSPPQRYPPSP